MKLTAPQKTARRCLRWLQTHRLPFKLTRGEWCVRPDSTKSADASIPCGGCALTAIAFICNKPWHAEGNRGSDSNVVRQSCEELFETPHHFLCNAIIDIFDGPEGEEHEDPVINMKRPMNKFKAILRRLAKQGDVDYKEVSKCSS